jgi:hypothetical protein
MSAAKKRGGENMTSDSEEEKNASMSFQVSFQQGFPTSFFKQTLQLSIKGKNGNNAQFK